MAYFIKRRPTRVKVNMDIAEAISKRSTCDRLGVGCIITYKGRIISSGYNGSPAGETHCVDCDVERKCEKAIHAERNAIEFITHTLGNEIPKGSKLYVSVSPCLECAKLIIDKGITHVRYRYAYRDKTPLKLLESKGVLVEKV